MSGRANATGTRCPACGEAVQPGPIVYGFPGPELFEAAERGEVVLGGCILTGNDPTHRCPRCETPLIHVDQRRFAIHLSALTCAFCGRQLGLDPADTASGDGGRAICGECVRARNFDLLWMGEGEDQ